MAAIRKRGDKWQVQIRRQELPTKTRSFTERKDALEWARHWEAQADRGNLPPSSKILDRMTLGELVSRYRDEIVPLKRSWEVETIILNAFLRDPLCTKILSRITKADFAAYRDKRLLTISPKSLSRQLSPLRAMFNLARDEWDIPLPMNPLAKLKLDENGCRRQRRLDPQHFDSLRGAAQRTRNPLIFPWCFWPLKPACVGGNSSG